MSYSPRPIRAVFSEACVSIFPKPELRRCLIAIVLPTAASPEHGGDRPGNGEGSLRGGRGWCNSSAHESRDQYKRTATTDKQR